MTSTQQKYTVGIVGAAGYTAAELIRILKYHPAIVITSLASESNSGKAVSAVHRDLVDMSLVFTDSIDPTVDIIFLCRGHGFSEVFLSVFKPKNPNQLIIDLSSDYRADRNKFIYGLPPIYKKQIKRSKYIANPGCFATAIQLGLLPLANQKLLHSDIHCTAITGSSGAGQKAVPTTHFSWRNNNVSSYKVFKHQHLAEINQSLIEYQADLPNIWFTPIRGNHVRGIFAMLNTESNTSLAELNQVFREYYINEPFIHISAEPVDLKMIVNTNNCILHLTKQGKMLQITSIIDNLILGASGQAVQNMNLALGLEETTGLHFKSIGL